MNGLWKKQDMNVQSEERMVHTTQVQELLSSEVMWWQLFNDIENLVANYYEVLGIDENEVKVL